MTQAEIAIHAVKIRRRCGLFAARRYVERMGCPMRLYVLACQLDAAKGVA